MMIRKVKFLSTLTFTSLLLFAPTSHAESNKTLMKKGQWKDPKTGLIWMRCSIGQKWTGSTCSGKAIELNFNDSKEYTRRFVNQKKRFGYNNWRLPNISELANIRYCSNGWTRNIQSKKVSELTENGRVLRNVNKDMGIRTIKINTVLPHSCEYPRKSPTINKNIFPKTDSNFYWSSTSHQNYDGAWGVFFPNGEISSSPKDVNEHTYLRLVRNAD